MIYFIDFDYTIADTSIMKSCIGNYKEKQKLIPQITIYKEAIDFINNLDKEEVYIVSGNVGSTIKKAIKQYEEGSETGDEWDFFPFTDEMLLFLDLDDDNHSKLYKLFKTELDNR